MPFSLANTLATFQAYINIFIARLLNYFVIIYLNNILIYLKNPKEHKKHMRQVIAKLYKYKLYTKLSKCEFGIQKLKFLGFRVKVDKVKLNFKKIYSIIKQLKLKLFYNIQVFLKFTNFYYRFIYKYLHMAYSFTNLLVNIKNSRKTTPIKQTSDTK